MPEFLRVGVVVDHDEGLGGLSQLGSIAETPEVGRVERDEDCRHFEVAHRRVEPEAPGRNS